MNEPGQDPAAPLGETRAAARGGVSLLVTQSLARLVALAFVMVVTRHLVPAEFGRYSAAAAIVLFANFLADFGTTPAVTRLVSRKPQDGAAILSSALQASTVLGLVAYGMALAFTAMAHPTATVSDMAIAGLAIPGASVLSSVLGALDGAGLLARRAVVSALQTVVVALGVVPVMMGAGVRAPLITLAASPWVALAVASAMARSAGLLRLSPGIDRDQIASLLRSALPFALSGGLAAISMRFDVILLSVVRSAPETASYDLALRVVEAVTYISTAVASPLFFVLNRRFGRGDIGGAASVYTEAVRLLYLLGLPLSITLAVLARPMVDAAFGSRYTAAATPLAILGAGMFVAFVTTVQGTLVMAGDHIRRGLTVSAAIVAFTLALDAVLVPVAGPGGAAAAMVVTWLAGAWAFDRHHRRMTGIATPLPPLRVLISVAAMGGAMFALRHQHLALPLVTGTAVYAICLVGSRAVTGDDFGRMRAMLTSR